MSHLSTKYLKNPEASDRRSLLPQHSMKLQTRLNHNRSHLLTIHNPFEDTEKVEHDEFKSKVSAIRNSKAKCRENYKDKLPPSIYNHIYNDSTLILRTPVNSVDSILSDDHNTSVKHVEIYNLINKKTAQPNWGASLFFDDNDRAEFPPRHRVNWRDSLKITVSDDRPDEAKENIDIYEENVNERITRSNEMSRSIFSDGNELPPLTEERKDKYFGDTAKNNFYHTYHEIDRMSRLVAGGLKVVEKIIQEEPRTRLSTAASAYTEDLEYSNDIDGLNTSSIISWGIPVPTTFPSLINPNNCLDNESSSQQPNDHTESAVTTRKSSFIGPQRDVEPELIDFNADDMLNLYRSTYNTNSPRATFLIGCLSHNLPPRALAVLRNRLTSKLDLSHFGLGDELISLLAKALADLPALEAIILKDNNLSDSGLETIINAISAHNRILELDLSSNKIGRRAACALGKFISIPDCPLVGLYVSGDCVEDKECSLFVDCLMKNTTLRELDLSCNLLGKDEQLNSFSPTVTGGQSLANLLRQSRCPLTKLNVHWNMIRENGAAHLCDSIRFTDKLIHLDLSYNGIGRHAATVLGSALLENHRLEELVISNNSIDAIGCFTIVVGAREHETLKYIDLDGNPIGEQGGRMLMKLAKYHGWRIQFSAYRCDANIKSKDVIFKTNEPLGTYQLDLSIPYHRAVACEILDVVALNPALGFKFFDIKEVGSKTFRPLKLVKFRQEIQPPDEVTLNDLKLLKAIAAIAGDEDLITRVFKYFDADNSGELDPDEFSYLLKKLGLDSSPEKVKAVMATLDADGECLINFDETKDYIWNIGRAARAQINEIESYPTFSAAEASPYRRYNLPMAGQVRLEIHEILTNAEEPGCLTKQQCKWLIESAERSNDPELLLEYGMELSTLYLDEAETLFKRFQAYQDANAVIVSKIVPRMATTMDANSIVKIHFGHNAQANRKLKKILGMAYYPLLGMYNGYYALDLASEYNRICLHKLIEQSVRKNAMRQGLKRGDTSQNGNWSCFRNVRRDGKLLSALECDKFSPMPKFGFLEFDFVDISRPNLNVEKPIQEEKLLQILRSCSIVRTQAQIDYVKARLRDKTSLRRSLGESRAPVTYWAPDTGRMVNAFDYLNKMYKSLDHRFTSYEQSFRKEIYSDKTNVSFGNKSTRDDESGYIEEDSVSVKDIKSLEVEPDQTIEKKSSHLSLYRKPQVLAIGSPRTSGNTLLSPRVEEASSPSNETDSLTQTVDPTMNNSFYKKIGFAQSPMSIVKSNQTPREQIEDSKSINISNNIRSDSAISMLSEKVVSERKLLSQREKNRYFKVLNDPKAPIEYKSSVLLHYLMTYLHTRFFTVQQLSIVLELFSFGSIPKSTVGSYRVELIVFLFVKILDLHNFGEILKLLTAEEHAAIIARLGWLNIMNPTKPEGVYRLDLSRWEERQVAKMLIHLSLAEPGTNWVDESFTFANQYDPMPGWTLTVVWYTEQGFPKQGILQLKMFSGDGMALGECKPDLSLRRMLLYQVLVDTEDLAYDIRSVRAPQLLKGPNQQTLNKNTSYFDDLTYRQLIQQQLKLDEDKYTLGSSINHMAKKTPLTWTYYLNWPGKGKNPNSPTKIKKKSTG